MAIHDLWSFDNSPIGTSLLGGTSDLTAVTNSSNPYAYYTGNPGMIVSYAGSTAVSSDGFLTMTRSSGGQDSFFTCLQGQCHNFTKSTKFWIGFRTKASYATTGSSAGKILSSVNGFNGSLLFILVNESDVVAAANTEAYVEVFIDTTALAYQVYVNGASVRSGTFTSGQIASGLYYLLGTGGTAAPASSTRGYRDFYFLDVDTSDTTRLGPIRSQPAVLAAAAGSEWTLNGSPANLLTALNTALQNPPVTTPSATSPTDKQPLVLTLSTSVAAGTPILAVQGQMSIAGDTGTNNIDSLLTQAGSQTDLGISAAPAGSMQYNQRTTGIARVAPDGGAWSPAKVNATTLTLTPQ